MTACIESDLQPNKLTKNILDSASVGIFWKDTSSRFVGSNITHQKFMGRSIDEMLGHTVEEIGAVSSQYPALIDDAEILAGKSICHVAGRLLDGSNVPRDVIISKSPLVIGSQIVGIVGTIEEEF